MAIDAKSWKPHRIFRYIQEKGNINDKEMYTVFNMGIGMVIVTDAKSVKNIQSRLLRYKIRSFTIGEIVKSSRQMHIR